MSPTSVALWFAVACAILASPVVAQPPVPAGERLQPPPPQPSPEVAPATAQAPPQNDSRVHGPVHEAFAAPALPAGSPPQQVPEPPPALPEELPPPVAPHEESGAAQWIPGYWGWDPRDANYVWVSGTWRSAPPQMEWVPGYWATEEGGCRWVSGFWTSGEVEQLAYLPAPPAPPEERPEPAPGDGCFWTPGHWQYVDGAYQWTPGFWAVAREDFVWTPASYVWTPRGYIFVQGYWDLPLETRGMLFAPLTAGQGTGGQIQPTIAIDVSEALVHWFVAPGYRHYCVGDYYGVERANGAIVSWYEQEARGAPVDALFAYYSRSDAQRFNSLATRHERYEQQFSQGSAGRWNDYAGAEGGGFAYSITEGQLPPGVVPFDVAREEFTDVLSYYGSVVDRRTEFERGAMVAVGQQPAYVRLDAFLPPGHGGLPPGLAKKGLVPPGFGGAPPGQTKKLNGAPGSFKKPPKANKGGGKGKGKGK